MILPVLAYGNPVLKKRCCDISKEFENLLKFVSRTCHFVQLLHVKGISNTILMGTPADKPIAVDGVFYVPYSIGRLFGMKQDNRVKG